MLQLRSFHHLLLFSFFVVIVLLIGYRSPPVWNRFHYRPTKFLSKRIDQRLHLLQQYFAHVNVSMLLRDRSITPNRSATLTYRCRQWCGGWGDRLRGITSTFILAVLSQRQFRIDMPYPCPLEKFLQPNLYDWQDQFSASDNRHVLNIEIMQDHQLAKQIYEKIASKDFLSEWSSYDDIYLTSNSDYITPVLTNPHLQDRVRLLNLSSDEMSQTQLFPLIYEILFRPTDVLMDLVDEILSRSDREMVKDLICLHFRIGMNPSMIEDQSFSYRETMVDDILVFLNRNITIGDQSLIFVTSDSAAINQRVLDHFGSERSVSISGPIIHIDRLSSIHSSTEQCQGFLKVLADFYVLGECDRLIMARSGFSHWASRRRLMTKQFDELYLYCRSVHRVTGHGWKRPHSVC